LGAFGELCKFIATAFWAKLKYFVEQKFADFYCYFLLKIFAPQKTLKNFGKRKLSFTFTFKVRLL
jgi:hypothetical protein